MLIEGIQKQNSVQDYNQWLLDNVKGELDTEEAQITLAKYLRHNVGVAAALLMGVSLHAYQEVLIRSWFERNFSMNVIGRGGAKSFCASVFIPLYMMFNPGHKICIVSSNFRTSRRILQQVEMFADSPNGQCLRQCFKGNNILKKRPDQWEMEMYNESLAFSLPLSNENLRGIRADVLCLDEFLLIPQEVFEKVLMPFLVAKTDQAKMIKIRKREDHLIAQGALKEEDRMVFPTMKKLLVLSSASYQYEYLYKKYRQWISKITGEVYEKTQDEFEEAIGKGNYFISQIGFDALPEDMMDESIIQEAQNGGDENSNFKREYRAQFTDDSGAYYSIAKMQSCTLPPGDSPCPEIIGDKDCEYVLAIDPARSASKNSDHFSMCLLKLVPDQRKGVLVHNYAVAGGEAEEHILYLRYLITKFNIVYLIIDNAGSEFIDYCNNSMIMKEAGIKLGFFDADFDNPDQQEAMLKIRNTYRRLDRVYCHKQFFSASWLRNSNEHLQTCFEAGYKKILFASKACVHPSFRAMRGLTIPVVNGSGDALLDAMTTFIEGQDDLMDLTKKECALIEMTATPMGNQHFDIPNFLKKSKQADKARKDSYTTLLLAAWGMRCYYLMHENRAPVYDNTFMPFAPQ